MKWLRVSIIAFLTLNVGLLYGRPKYPIRPSKVFQLKWVKYNNVAMPITNYATWGQNEAGTAGAEYPKGSGEPYVFGAGIWIGAIKNGQPTLACGYDPRNGWTEFTPGPPENADDYSGGNTQAHPEDSIYFVTETTSSSLVPDWIPRDTSGGVATLPGYDLDAWCEYHDLLAERHEEGEPLGIYVRQLCAVWNDEYRNNMVFFIYEFKNVSDDTLKEVYVGIGCDMDVGYADNDLVGCDIYRSLGWTMTATEEQGWSSSPPYYVGVKFLQGPRADDTVYVRVHPDSAGYPLKARDTILPGQLIPLTAFSYYDREQAPADNEYKKYQCLKGVDFVTGGYNPWRIYDNTPLDKRMTLSSGPFTMDPGEVDTFVIAVIFVNGDIGGYNKLLECSDMIDVLFKGGWTFPSPPAVSNLQAIPGDGYIMLIWDDLAELSVDPYKPSDWPSNWPAYINDRSDFQGYRLWKSRTGLADDWELIGQWDIKDEITLLPGDYYIPGMGNISGEESNNNGLVHFYVDSNVINGVDYYYALTSYDFNIDVFNKGSQARYTALESGKQAVSCRAMSYPNNYEHASVTSCSLTAGNVNTVKLDPIALGEPGITGHEYQIEWLGISGLTDEDLPIYTFNIKDVTEGKTLFNLPQEVVPEVSEVTLSYTVRSVRNQQTTPESTVTIDTIVIYEETKNSWASKFAVAADGIFIDGDLDIVQEKVYDTICMVITTVSKSGTVVRKDTVVDTVYKTSEDWFELPSDVVIVQDVGTQYSGTPTVFDFYSEGNNKKWAYRGGANIVIEWEYWHGHPDTITMYVYDASSGTEIPFDTTFGDNWCFSWGGQYLTSGMGAIPNYYLWFYVCGVRIYYNNGQPLNWAWHPDSGDVWEIRSNAKSVVPYKGNVFKITTEQGKYTEVYDFKKIKVVPNPYLGRADWDKSRDYRKIMFTNLPDECTIRIYTLAGDLIKVIHHKAGTGASYEGGSEAWDLLTDNDQVVASGVYIYHVTTPNGKTYVGKFAIIR